MSLPPAARRARFPLRDRPGLVWLTLAVLVTLAHPVVPAASWLVVHLVLLGAVTHSAMVWSTHFTQALLKTPDSLDDRRRQNRRILALLAGAALVLVGVPGSWWPLTVTGAALVSLSVALHGLALRRRLRHALPGRFRITVRYYLVAASCVPVGAALGAWLARGLDDEQHGRVLVAHSLVMVLGWLGLTVTGTLVTLWPTMLRTRMDDRAERLARQALPVLSGALILLAAAALAGRRDIALVGLAVYLAGLSWWGRALLAPTRQSPPRTVATVSVLAAAAWGLVAVVLVGVRLATRPSWSAVADGYDVVAAVVAVGFAGQLLTGALAHLIPVVLGGGPSVARAASRRFDRAWVARVVVVNVGLLVCLLPVPAAVRVSVAVLVLASLAVFVPLLLSAVRAAVAARRALLERVADGPPTLPVAPGLPAVAATGTGGQVVAGMALVALAVSLGVAAGPPSTGSQPGPAVAVQATGHTTRVRVEAHDMAYSPSAVTVPAGDRLVVDLVNVDPGSPHDLIFEDGSGTSRVMPGRSETLDVGILGADTDGWCSIVGHRQMGMMLHVRVTGAPPPSTSAASELALPGPQTQVDLTHDVDPGFRAVNATVPPLEPSREHRVTLHVRESVLDVAPGVRQRRWTFDGGVPGPTLHGRVGDTFVVTLVNEATMGHSIDFHAGEAVPAQVMRTIPPGGRLTYRFTADRAGLWMYHCSTMPMSTHIAAGMFGAVLIEPPDLPAVDHSYLLVQSEAHLDGDGRTAPAGVDAASASADTPDLVTFNGIADQYLARPLTARQGQRVRLWVLAAGPNRGSSFHVVGTQFDTVWSEGSYLLRHGRGAGGSTHGGAQTLALAVAQGGFAEITAGRPGVYPFVTHQMSDAERGARGAIAITP